MQEVLLKRAGEEPGHRSRLTLSANLGPFPPFSFAAGLALKRVSPLARSPPAHPRAPQPTL